MLSRKTSTKFTDNICNGRISVGTEQGQALPGGLHERFCLRVGRDARYSLSHPGWRKSMEDAAIHTTNIGDGNSLFAVFDGHGGTPAGTQASR
jgi:hypothetical protein